MYGTVYSGPVMIRGAVNDEAIKLREYTRVSREGVDGWVKSYELTYMIAGSGLVKPSLPSLEEFCSFKESGAF